MLDKIMDMVGSDAVSAMAGKAGISVLQAKSLLPLAGESLQEGLMSQVTSGNIDGVLGMFKSFTGGGLESNSIFGNLKNMFMKKVMTSMGPPESVAGMVAGSGMSSIIGSLAGKMKEHGDTNEIDAASLMGVLGGDGGGMLGNIAGMLGDTSKGSALDTLKGAAKGKFGDIAGGLFGK